MARVVAMTGRAASAAAGQPGAAGRAEAAAVGSKTRPGARHVRHGVAAEPKGIAGAGRAHRFGIDRSSGRRQTHQPGYEGEHRRPRDPSASSFNEIHLKVTPLVSRQPRRALIFRHNAERTASGGARGRNVTRRRHLPRLIAQKRAHHGRSCGKCRTAFRRHGESWPPGRRIFAGARASRIGYQDCACVPSSMGAPPGA